MDKFIEWMANSPQGVLSSHFTAEFIFSDGSVAKTQNVFASHPICFKYLLIKYPSWINTYTDSFI